MWAIGFLGLAASGTAAQWEWVLSFLGPLILAIAVLMSGAFVRDRYGVGALVLFVLALVIQAVVFLPRTLGIDVVGPGGTSFSYDAWGLAWIVGAIGVLLVDTTSQSPDGTTAGKLPPFWSTQMLTGPAASGVPAIAVPQPTPYSTAS